MKEGISTTPGATNAEWRTTEPGTARKPASRKRDASQPSNLDATLSHQAASPGPPGMTLLSLSRNDSSTAFLSHWLTCHLPSAPRSATRTRPRSSKSSAVSTASRTVPLVDGPMPSRASKASSIDLASASWDMGYIPNCGADEDGVFSGKAGGSQGDAPAAARCCSLP